MNIDLNVYGIDNKKVYDYENKVKKNHKELVNKTGKGNDFLGWLNYENAFDDEIINNILKVSEEIKKEADVFIVLGIGGSYLGAKAMTEALGGFFRRKEVEIIYAGYNLSGEYLLELLDYIEDKSVYVNVISKSGTTIETALSFRTIKEFMINKYPKEYRKRIIATTDSKKGVLREFAEINKIRTFSIPDDIGGRYSVFTAVGLLPMAVAGLDINDILMGLKKSILDFGEESIENNKAYYYAVSRNLLYKNGKKIEIFVNHNPKLSYLGEWLKQLFGESEGKEGKGVFPASVLFSTDLHSLGQLIQEGERNIFETMIVVNKPKEDLIIKKDKENIDKLNYLEGRSFEEIDKIMLSSARKAHLSGNVPCVVIEINQLDEYNLSYLMYFFMKACAMSGYLLGVNPFNQPGVEAYKKNMRELL